MSDRKELLQKFGLIGLANLIFSLNSIVLLPVLTKNLTVEEYGIWAQIIVAVGFTPLLLMFGLQYSMARFIQSASNKSDVQELFYSILFFIATVSLGASLTVYLFAQRLSLLFFEGETIIVQILSVIILMETINAVLLHFFRSSQQTKKYTIFLLTQTLIHIFLISALVILGKGIYGAIIAVLLKSIILFTVMLFFIIKTIGFKLPKFKYLKGHITFGLPTMPSELSTWIVSSSDKLIISYLLGAVFVGYYAPAYTLGNNIMHGIITPIALILPPFLAKLHDSNNMKDIEIILENTLKYFLFFGIPATFGLFFLSRPILRLLTTEEIASESSLVLSLTAISTLIFGVSTIINQIAILNKKTRVIGKIWLGSAVFKVALNFLMIPHTGIIGAAIVTLIVFIIGLAFSSNYCLRIIKIKLDLGFILKSILASTTMSILLLNSNPIGTIQLFKIIIISAFLYIVVMFSLQSFKREEIIYFKSSIFNTLRIK